MKISKRILFASLLFPVGLFFCELGHGYTLSWKGSDFSLRAHQMLLSSILKTLSDEYDTPVSVDPSITATFSGNISPLPPMEILRKLVNDNNLVAYYDGATLFIYPALRVEHHIITLNVLSAATFIANLRKLGIPESRTCEVRPILGAQALEVRGVPACFSRISQLAATLDGEMSKRQDDAVSVEVYPLKFATAVDDRYQYRDQTVVVPGIVSVLRDMNRASTPSTNSNPGAPVTQGLPLFSADPRQNAVIVRDRTANMAGYRKLISELDQRPQMIEISVAIIDVDAADVGQLGIDWSAAVSLGGGSITFNNNKGALDGGFSSVIRDTPNFMMRLSALEQNSHAYILSQPSVVTLNNIQAVLDKNITFYTKLEGDKVAKLESVTTGSLLRVTPRLIEKEGRQNIMLNLNIQDGLQSTPLNPTDPIPQILNSEIASQATLQAGQSLLLGGFKQDKQMTSQSKIPLLGDIPLLGHLFKSQNNTTQSVIRLFLIKASVANSLQ